MRRLRALFFICLLTASYGAIAQSDYEIFTTTTSEKFDSEGKLVSRHLWASGVQGEEIINVDIIVDPNNKVKELTVNDNEVKPPMFKEYKSITDYVIAYIDQDIETAPTDGSSKTTLVGEPADEDKATKSDKKALMNLVKDELVNDKLIDNPDVFDFMLTFDSLYINAKKQDEAVFKKYKALYEKYSTIPLAKTTYFQITQTL